jgi:hypothetical protein
VARRRNLRQYELTSFGPEWDAELLRAAFDRTGPLLPFRFVASKLASLRGARKLIRRGAP